MRFTPPDGVLNLAQTLDCGQSFRFYPVTLENNIPAWRGVAFSRGLTVYQDENNDLVLDCTEQEFRDIWFDYFDFNTDYQKSREVLSALHPALKEAAEFAGGIRILKQEPFEALCSFIISQNNNIPRIKGIIERLCLHFGEPFLYHNETRYAFPTPKNWSPARRKTLLRCARAFARNISLMPQSASLPARSIWKPCAKCLFPMPKRNCRRFQASAQKSRTALCSTVCTARSASRWTCG